MPKKINDNAKNIASDVELHEKWGEIIKGYGGGFTAVPNLILKKQSELGLKPNELNVLINLIRFWWSTEKLPFPDLGIMAIEMGVSERTLYRSISSLEEKGFIKRIQIEGQRTKYDLAGLIEKLKVIKNAM